MNIIKRIKTLWFLSGLNEQELMQLTSLPQPKDEVYLIKSWEGGELIMPSPIKEAFDEGKIKSIGDIIS